MTRTIQVVVVSGAEGKSLQLWNKNGGKRIAGPKAWGNPYNKPLASFTVDADELMKSIDRLAECEEPDLEDASLPRMPVSRRTVTLHEEPAETTKERVIRVINQSEEEWFAGDPTGGLSNLPSERMTAKSGEIIGLSAMTGTPAPSILPFMGAGECPAELLMPPLPAPKPAKLGRTEHSDDCGLGVAGGICDCGYIGPPAPVEVYADGILICACGWKGTAAQFAEHRRTPMDICGPVEEVKPPDAEGAELVAKRKTKGGEET